MPERPLTLTAAAVPLLGEGALSIGLLQRARSTQVWQSTAWSYYDEIPEVNFAHRYQGNAVGRVRLFPQYTPSSGELPVPLDPDDDTLDDNIRKLAAYAAATMDRLDASLGGSTGLLSTLALNCSLVGEVYLWGHADDDSPSGETWEALSTDEIRVTGTDIQLIGEATAEDERKIEPDDHLIRIWRRHPRWRLRADASMRSLLTTCEELLLLGRSIRAVATSRLAGAGFLKKPLELSFGRPSIDGGEPPTDGEADPFIADLIDAMITPIRDPDSASAVVPILVEGPSEALKEFGHITIERPFDSLSVQLREEAVTRLARGMDIPPEILLGLADANHWTAWQIDEQTFKAHTEPLVALLAEGLTVGFLQPLLRQGEIAEWTQVSIGWDPGALIGHPNEFQDTTVMHSSLVISDAAFRRVGGVSEDDAPDEEEYARRLAAKQALPPEVTSMLLRLGEVLPALEAIAEPPAGEPEGPPEEDETERPADRDNVEPGPPDVPTLASSAINLGSQLGALRRSLRARTLALSESTVTRAIEIVGARIVRTIGTSSEKYADQRALIKDLPLRQVAQVLGALEVHRLGVTESEIIDRHIASIEAQFLACITRNRKEALRLITAVSGSPKDTFDVVLWDAHCIGNEKAAWLDYRNELSSIATTRLWTDRDDDGFGEQPVEEHVPASFVRNALRFADDDLLDYLDAVDVAAQGWVWVYGDPSARTRPFEPHEELDGLTFERFDDDVLLNTDPWPDVTYFFPGDHDGCLCDVEPIFMEA